LMSSGNNVSVLNVQPETDSSVSVTLLISVYNGNPSSVYSDMRNAIHVVVFYATSVYDYQLTFIPDPSSVSVQYKVAPFTKPPSYEIGDRVQTTDDYWSRSTTTEYSYWWGGRPTKYPYYSWDYPEYNSSKTKVIVGVSVTCGVLLIGAVLVAGIIVYKRRRLQPTGQAYRQLAETTEVSRVDRIKELLMDKPEVLSY